MSKLNQAAWYQDSTLMTWLGRGLFQWQVTTVEQFSKQPLGTLGISWSPLFFGWRARRNATVVTFAPWSQGRASTTFSLEPGAWCDGHLGHLGHGLTILRREDGACRLNGGTELTLHLMEGHATKSMTTVFLFNNKAGRLWRQSAVSNLQKPSEIPRNSIFFRISWMIFGDFRADSFLFFCAGRPSTKCGSLVLSVDL